MLNNPVLNDKLLEQFNSFIHEKTGFIFEKKDLNKLEARIQNRLKHLSINSLDDYYQHLYRNEDEILELINHIIINETTFFRHEDQYYILADLIKKNSEKYSVINILSAGCSTGEEPYSIAMFLKTHLSSSIFDRIRISAMDISSFNIKIGQRGIYPQLKIDKIKDKNFVKGYFNKFDEEDNYQLPQAIKSKVQFSIENLFTVNFKTKFNFIFCRNVMIYFSEEKRNFLLEKFHSHLHELGFFFLAPTESLLDSKKLFERVRVENVTYYKKVLEKNVSSAAEKNKSINLSLQENNQKSAKISGFGMPSKKKEFEIKFREKRGNIAVFECFGIFERKNINEINLLFKSYISSAASKGKFGNIAFLLNNVKYIDAQVLKDIGVCLQKDFSFLKKLYAVSDKEQIMRIFEFHELDGLFELAEKTSDIN
ncbi:protein-glutamate O-methyltransferase CheR [Candidatus Dependentiae bacterium]|nr:protein-glutamate O-methyltransferase CheR [Candidatus Dependentiae bacterium]